MLRFDSSTPFVFKFKFLLVIFFTSGVVKAQCIHGMDEAALLSDAVVGAISTFRSSDGDKQAILHWYFLDSENNKHMHSARLQNNDVFSESISILEDTSKGSIIEYILMWQTPRGAELVSDTDSDQVIRINIGRFNAELGVDAMLEENQLKSPRIPIPSMLGCGVNLLRLK